MSSRVYNKSTRAVRHINVGDYVTCVRGKFVGLYGVVVDVFPFLGDVRTKIKVKFNYTDNKSVLKTRLRYIEAKNHYLRNWSLVVSWERYEV